MPCTGFYVGQKVVCVDDAPAPGFEHYKMEIKNGEKYIIASFAGPAFLDGAPTVSLEGIRLSTPGFGFWARRFRPIVETSTKSGMATLYEILDRETVREREPLKHPAR